MRWCSPSVQTSSNSTRRRCACGLLLRQERPSGPGGPDRVCEVDLSGASVLRSLPRKFPLRRPTEQVSRRAKGDCVDTGQLWASCRQGDSASRCALIERYAPLATSVARRMRVPTGALMGRDDVESAALVGLFNAVDRYDSERGVPFEGYAGLRIRGAILDELRRLDDRSRGERQRARTVAADTEPAIGAYGGGPPPPLIPQARERRWGGRDGRRQRGQGH